MEVIVFSWDEHTGFYPIPMVSPENMHIHAAFYRLSRFYLWIQEKKHMNTDMRVCIYLNKKRCESELKQGGYKSDFGGRKGEEENYIIIW